MLLDLIRLQKTLRDSTAGVVDLASTPGDARRIEALTRRSSTASPEVRDSVAEILARVRDEGDPAVREFTERFDHRSPEYPGYEIAPDRWQKAIDGVAPSLLAALAKAAQQIRAFHGHQIESDYVIERQGSRLMMRVTPLKRVGIYVPGGTARYPSSVLMTAIPAHVAGVGEIIMVTPGASDETLAAAKLAGVHRIFEIGGAQAVGALAYGTAAIPRVDKIVGPGNQWVAEAKRQVYGAVDIDSIAGPSEVLIIADDSAHPGWIAADLLAQAEHDVEARPILVTTDEDLVYAVDRALSHQLVSLPRSEIARTSLQRHGTAVVVSSRESAVFFANCYAPEHLELQIRNPRDVVGDLHSSGAIFVGPYTPEAIGDYVAGPNHVLPTGGAARYASPLGVHDFRKRTSVIEYSRELLFAHAQVVIELAGVEGLDAHGRSVAMRVATDPDSD